MKLFKAGIISWLLFIIAFLLAYIVISSDTSLLKIPINIYLKKYSIDSNFKKLKIKSPKDFEFDGFYLKNNGFSFSADVLKISINNNGSVSVFVKNAALVVKKKDKQNDKSKFRLPFIVSKAEIENLKVTVIDKKSTILKAQNLNIHMEKNNIWASGKIIYRSKSVNLYADIDSLKGGIKFSRSAVFFNNLSILPKNINIKVNNTVLKVSKRINVKGLYITLSPLDINLVNMQSDISASVLDYSISSKLKLNAEYGSKFVTSAKFNDINSKSDIITGNSVKITISGKKKFKIKTEYDNITINYKYIVSQNLCGYLKYKNSIIQSEIDAGEAVFYDRWYINFKNFPLKAVFKQSRIHKLNFNLNNLVVGNIYFSNKNKLDFELKIKDIATFYNNFIKNAYEIDFLDKIKIGQGRLEFKGLYSIKNRDLMGKIKAFLDRVSYNDKLFFRNISFIFPFFYGINGEKNGFLKIDNISLDKENFSVYSKIYAKRDVLVFKNNIFGISHFNIKPFAVNINLRKRELKSLIDFVFHDDKTKAIGKFKKIILKHDVLTTKGAITVNIFKGKVRIKNIKIKSIFTLPVLYADIDFEHISLSDITKNTNFGLMSGYIEGYIHNLSLVQFRNPLSFNMLIKTQDVKGASQKITLKAINSISRIGGGYVKIAIPFFKSFPYSKIGLRAFLKNNIFKMHGLYVDGGKEYIIKKGFLVGVSVINMNKNNSISWDDMIERIKRVLNSSDVKIK